MTLRSLMTEMSVDGSVFAGLLAAFFFFLGEDSPSSGLASDLVFFGASLLKYTVKFSLLQNLWGEVP